MKICISDDLLNIKNDLKKRGYDVLPWNSKDSYDALICDLKNVGLTNILHENSAKKEGVLIIDIGSKTIDEIEYILNNRLYTYII